MSKFSRDFLQLFQLLKNKTSSLFMILPILATAWFPFFGSPSFWSGDDVMNLLAYSGGYSGDIEWKSHIQSPVFGLLSATLYSFTSEVPWYPILILLVPLISSLLLLSDLKTIINSSLKLQVVIPISFALLLLGAHLNYTLASFITSSIGVSWLVLRIKSAAVRPKNFIGPLIVCTFGIALRTDWSSPIVIPPTFMLASVLGLLMLGFSVNQKHKIQFQYFFGVLSIAYCINYFPQLMIMQFDPEWASYIEFYYSTGFTWSNHFRSYFQSTDLKAIEDATGIGRFGLSQASQYIYFDSQSLPTDALQRLGDASLNKFNKELGLVGRAKSMLQVLISFFSWSSVIFFAVAVAVQVQNKSRLIFNYTKILSLTLAPALMLSWSTYAYLLSNYVLAGVSFTVFIFLAMSNVLEQNRLKPVVPKRSLESLPILLLIVASSYFSLGRQAIISSKEVAAYDQTTLIELNDSNNYAYPAFDLKWVNFIPKAFDNDFVSVYKNSKNVTPNGEYRSPYFVKRWNMITGSNETTKSLFNAKIYEKILFRAELAQQISELFYRETGVCLKPQHIEHRDFFLLQQKPSLNCLIRVTDGDSMKPPADVYSSDEGFFVTVLSESVQNIRIFLQSPFGEYAKNHDVKFVHFDERNKTKETLFLKVVPSNDSEVSIYDLNIGDRILVYSESPCIVPAEVVPGSTDFRSRCIGVVRIDVNGETIVLP